MNWANDTSQPYTVDQAVTGYAGLDNWYREVSYQQTSLDVDVFGRFTMPIGEGSEAAIGLECPSRSLSDQALIWPLPSMIHL